MMTWPRIEMVIFVCQDLAATSQADTHIVVGQTVPLPHVIPDWLIKMPIFTTTDNLGLQKYVLLFE